MKAIAVGGKHHGKEFEVGPAVAYDFTGTVRSEDLYIDSGTQDTKGRRVYLSPMSRPKK